MKRFIKTLSAVVVMATMSMSIITFNSSAAAKTGTDPNGDGSVDIADVVYIESYLKGQFEVSDLSAMDFNGDCIVNKADVIAVQRHLAGMDF